LTVNWDSATACYSCDPEARARREAILQAAKREAADRAAQREEHRRRELAEKEARRLATIAAEKEAAEQKIASREAYLKWQKQINHRDEKEQIRALWNAPKETETKRRSIVRGGSIETNRRRH
jgi:hypothetical protein